MLCQADVVHKPLFDCLKVKLGLGFNPRGPGGTRGAPGGTKGAPGRGLALERVVAPDLTQEARDFQVLNHGQHCQEFDFLFF